MTRQHINTRHLTYQVNNLTNLINHSVQDLNFQQFTTSTPQSYQQTGANRSAPTPPPPFIPTNVTPPTEFPTDLSGFCNIQGSCDPNARSAMQAQLLQKTKKHSGNNSLLKC